MGSVAETLEFDETVKVALDFARKNKNTLVIVTADHETGGLSVLQNAPYRKGEELIVHFSTGGHSGVPVPVYSYGPGSDNFTGVLENTYFKATLARLMKLKP
jgi:alkaline phosphatase